MDNLIKRTTELLKIKNIITIMATLVFVVMALKGDIKAEDTMMIIMLIYTYFFNKNTTDVK